MHASCWGPSSSEGPQKHDLTMFLWCNIWTGAFELGSEPHTVWKARTIRRLTQRRSYAQGSFGITAEKRTDLKGKRLFRPRWITLESLANAKGMDIISHGLRPVSINRWTVLPYCSRWLVILLLRHACTFTFLRAKGTFVIWYHFYFSIVIKLKWVDI